MYVQSGGEAEGVSGHVSLALKGVFQISRILCTSATDVSDSKNIVYSAGDAYKLNST